MRSQEFFFHDADSEISQQGEYLLFPLLLIIFIFGLLMLNPNSSEKISSSYNNSKATASQTQADSKKSIVDIIYSCSLTSISEKGHHCF